MTVGPTFRKHNQYQHNHLKNQLYALMTITGNAEKTGESQEQKRELSIYNRDVPKANEVSQKITDLNNTISACSLIP